jgi:hypothetical protein
MPVKVAALERMLCGKLAAAAVEGSKHTQYVVWHEGQKIAFTILSRSYAEIDESLVSAIARQLHVNRRQLQLLIDCPWSRDTYITHVLGDQRTSPTGNTQ